MIEHLKTGQLFVKIFLLEKNEIVTQLTYCKLLCCIINAEMEELDGKEAGLSMSPS